MAGRVACALFFLARVSTKRKSVLSSCREWGRQDGYRWQAGGDVRPQLAFNTPQYYLYLHRSLGRGGVAAPHVRRTR